MAEQTDEQYEYEVTFLIDGIYATSAKEAAQYVAELLSPDVSGYAHRGVYVVVRRHDDKAETIDLAEQADDE